MHICNYVAKLRVSLPRLLIYLIVPLLLYTWYDFAIHVVGPALQPWPGTGRLWPDSAGWVAARLGWEGHAELMYDSEAFARESVRLGAHQDTFDANLPPTALTFLPLAPLPISVAYPLWTFISIACLAVAWLRLLRMLRLQLPIVLALSALVPLYQPWRQHVIYGQVYALMMLLAVQAASSILKEQTGKLYPSGQYINVARGQLRAQIQAGLALGVACVVRFYYGAVILLPTFVRRKWMVLFVATTLFCTAALVTMVWWGIDLWPTAVHLSLAWRERPSTALVAYQSLYSFLVHMFRYDVTFNPGPIVDSPGLVGPIWWAVAVTLLTITVAALWRDSRYTKQTIAQQLVPLAISIVVALLLAPTNLEYHYTLLLFPLPVASALLWVRRAGVAPWLTWAASAVLIGAPFPYNVSNVVGWQALLHYPRLYGTLLLWVLLLGQLWKQQPDFTNTTASASADEDSERST